MSWKVYSRTNFSLWSRVISQNRLAWALLIAGTILYAISCQSDPADQISFNRDIRPILNEKCMRCHGGVRAMGGFSLLFEDTALGDTESGRPAIIPGNHKNSELYRRLISDDPEHRMPLDAAPLSDSEIDRIARWIDEGANWEKHWAYLPLDALIIPPSPAHQDWALNDIDRFTSDAMAENGLSPNPEAPRVDLMRRLYFDLTGLPPTPREAEAFLADQRPDAYEKLVDQLLASPHFGERWATMWLDLARYADTKGYEKDSNRNIWKYRDWVIRAFNEDMPFDQFTIEQLAGDLLENPDQDQLIATAFHRNSIANDEGGTDDETFRVASVIERVGTTYEVWQSTTMACVQCHSHPYDPFLHEEFYTSMAFFNNSEDRDIYSEQPKLYTYSPENAEKVKEIITWIKTRLKPEHQPLTSGFLHDQKDELLTGLGYRTVEAEEYTKSSPLIELIRPDQEMLWQIQDSSWIYFREVDLTDVERIGFRTASMLDFAGTISIHLGALDGPKIGEVKVTKSGEWPGWQGNRPTDAEDYAEFITPITPTEGKHRIYYKFGLGDTYIQHLFYLDKITYYERDPALQQYPADLRQKLDELAAVPAETTPIIRDLPPDRSRTTRVYERGNWLTPGDTVRSGIPHLFTEGMKDPPRDRLAFARWLVSPQAPLTSRVIVNRIWEQIFGRGLVASMEEFGSQGEKPSHPELLDWLAVRLLVDHGWSLKSLIRELVLSATYRQSSQTSAEKLEQDPDNIWLARGGRTRLSAEQIRDQILALSGLLDPKIGGPSIVLPELGISPREIPHWVLTQEEDRYRRTLYTFWKRTDPFPDMITFDSPDRALCSSQRIRTNTPLQALNLLNDEIYFAAAGTFARRLFREFETPPQQISQAYRQLLFKAPDASKLKLLEELYERSFTHYQENPDERDALVPESTYNETEKTKLAALCIVANALFNLDELIVKS
ncbi:DUF1553 domain-containing protein [Flavilitoribacter nigricans]|uniref:Cytochrome c domain-containing protein n=1 Tax=Flavilitoribacter nigricans (strain ATCC 23147 / DSM 23189 / NBRC 102662 / NCIMB 1420 / SS-2) TaxID=1122177 RepID=A0A2D0N327_FLAN2|nr:DUF1553 domain-containing protein [Flavilitoribacter nigricans]PHN02810.1 hypothetical protein CRP01_29970 [Flavilitoribacter nigricans DSM 23189 = NBRC 102662]